MATFSGKHTHDKDPLPDGCLLQVAWEVVSDQELINILYKLGREFVPHLSYTVISPAFKDRIFQAHTDFEALGLIRQALEKSLDPNMIDRLMDVLSREEIGQRIFAERINVIYQRRLSEHYCDKCRRLKTIQASSTSQQTGDRPYIGGEKVRMLSIETKDMDAAQYMYQHMGLGKNEKLPKRIHDKREELKAVVLAEHDRLENELMTMKDHLKRIDLLGTEEKEAETQKLNQLIEIWNQKGRTHVEPLQHQPQGDGSQSMQSSNDELKRMESLVLADLEDNPHEDIQAIYVDCESNKVTIDVKWNCSGEIEGHMNDLKAYNQYQNFITILENSPGQNLMPNDQLASAENPCSSKLVGHGAAITVMNIPEERLREILANRSISSLSQAANHLETNTSGGTLGCLCKVNREFHIMTAQHVLSTDHTDSASKHILTEVNYSCDGLGIADWLHLSSSHFGKYGAVNGRAIDVALMKLSQRYLATGAMKTIPIFTRSHIGALFPDRPSMLGRIVSKTGATTGYTQGEIIMEDFAYGIGKQFGKMFAVDVSDNLYPVYADKGDSGALVTIEIEGHAGQTEEYALGIVSQKKRVCGRENAVLCVWLEDCLDVLRSEGLLTSDPTLYKGYLTVKASVNSRREAFKEEPPH